MRRVRQVPVATALAVALLAGCAVGPDYQSPDTGELTPAAFPAAEGTLPGAAPRERWWDAFGDPVLADLVDRALVGNPDLAAAEARVQQARAVARAAGAAFYPTLDATARISRDQLSSNSEMLSLVRIKPSTTQFTDYRIGFDAAWELDLAGRTRREVEAAVARLDSTRETRNDARLVVAAEVARSYVEYRVAAARLEVANAQVANLDESRRLTALARAAGEASEADLAAAEAERLDAAGAVAPVEAELQSATFALAALTGDSVESLAARLAGPAAIPATPATAPVGLPSDLLLRRPDVRQAERELAAATADVGSAIAAQFPRLTLVGQFGWDSVDSGTLTDAASRYWSYGPQLSVPLFEGGRLRSQADAARAAREAALASYRGAVLRAFADTESAIVRYAAELRRQSQLTEALARRESNLAHERRRYEAGDVSQLDVLAAERLVHRAADQRALSAGQLAQDYVALGKALGGGWQDIQP